MSCEADNTETNLAEIAKIYAEAQKSGVTEAELAQAKSKINSRVVLSSERPRGRLFTVGGNWLQRRKYRTVQKDLQAIDAVTLKDIAAVLAKYPLTRSTTLAIGPAAKLHAPS